MLADPDSADAGRRLEVAVELALGPRPADVAHHDERMRVPTDLCDRLQPGRLVDRVRGVGVRLDMDRLDDVLSVELAMQAVRGPVDAEGSVVAEQLVLE